MVHSSHNHIPAYQREGFRQSLGDREGWTLDESDKQFGALVYRRGEEIAVVPNIWYNQPVAWRIKAVLFQADRADDCAAAKEEAAAGPYAKPWEAGEAALSRATAVRLRTLAEEMQRTGQVLA